MRAGYMLPAGLSATSMGDIGLVFTHIHGFENTDFVNFSSRC
jgi:hypothetical protein